MILSLIAKQRVTETNKWWNFSTLRKGVWYDVKFVHDAAPPKVYDIDKPNKVMRAYVSVTPEQCDIADKNGRKTIFVNDYSTLSADDMKPYVEADRARIAEFREKRNKEKMNFFDDNVAPTAVDTPDPVKMPPPTADDLPF